MTGYRLHLRRFSFTGKQGMRSIKFPISFEDKEKNNAFAKDIAKDYIRQVGPITLSAWLETKNAPLQETYALTDFWLDALRAGFVFAKGADHLPKILAHTGERTLDDTSVREAFQKHVPDIAPYVHWDKFKDAFLLPKQIRSSATEESIKRRFFDCVDVSVREKPLKHLEDFASPLATLRGKKTEEQNMFWHEQCGINKKFFTRGAQQGTQSSYSGVSIPSLPFQPDADFQTLLNTYLEHGAQWFHGEDKEYIQKRIQECIGLTDNYNALSNYFGGILACFHEQKEEDLIAAYIALVPSWKEKETELRARIKWLGDRARLLPKEPHFSSTWADYRSTVGGKISSWYSNRAAQGERIKEVLEEHHEALERVELFLQEYEKKADFTERVERIRAQCMLLKNMKKSVDGNTLMAYADTLAFLRSDLLPLVQQTINEYSDERAQELKKKSKALGIESLLHKDVPRLPRFVGEGKRDVYVRYEEAYTRYEQGVNLLRYTEKHLYPYITEGNTDKISIQKTLNTFLGLYRRGLSPRFAQILEKMFKEFALDVRALAVDKRVRLYKSQYAKGYGIIVPEISISNTAVAARYIVEHTLPRFDELHTTRERLEAVEIAKIRFGLLAQLCSETQTEVTFTQEQMKGFDRAQGFLTLLGKYTIQGDLLVRFIEQYVCAEMRGALSLMSREAFAVRSVVQVMNSEDKWPLVFVPRNATEGVCRENRKRWALVRKEDANKKQSTVAPLEVYIKKEKKCSGADAQEEGYEKRFVSPSALLFISSSRDQLQFLDNTLATRTGRSAWVNFSPELSSYSFIVEEQYRADWKSGTPKLTHTGSRVFVSIPFGLGRENKTRTALLKERTCFLGVDVGEYGLAFALFDYATGVCGPSGFVSIPSLRKIRDGITENKERQAGGTFAMPSRYIERLRHDAITALRNQIHDIAVRHNARIVYEDSISNFETGSGRVTKVYNSVKRADVFSDTDAEKAEKQLLWGKGSGLVGFTVGARGTSRVCSHCFESPYAYLHESEDTRAEVIQITVLNKKGEREVRVRLQEDKEAIGFLTSSFRQIQVGDFLYAKETIQALYNASRPPLDSLRVAEAVRMFPPEEILAFRRSRGNSAIFVCPFCSHVSDADIQAALIIGLKKMWREKEHTTRKAHGIQKSESQEELPEEKIRAFKLFTLFARKKYLNEWGAQPIPFDPKQTG